MLSQYHSELVTARQNRSLYNSISLCKLLGIYTSYETLLRHAPAVEKSFNPNSNFHLSSPIYSWQCITS